MKRIALLFVSLAGLSAAEPQLVAPDRTKALLLDPRVVQSAVNAKLTLGAIEKESRNPLFRADQPWENALNNLYPNVLWDERERLFKLWYKCVLTDKEVIAKMAAPVTIHDQGWFLLYATSRDGLAWEKPAIGQFEFDGSRANNAVARDTPNVGVFRDPHDPDAARRFKMVYDVGLGKLRTRTSPDGVKWSEPQEPQGFASFNGDTHNNAFWDERSGRYVWFTKAYLGERLVARFESEDFVHWKSSGVVLRSTIEEGRAHQTYCMPVFPYANGYLGFVMMYHVGTDRSVDCELAWSPDTITWKRIAPGVPFIPRGPKGSYDGACIYAPSGPAIAQDGRLLIFYGGDFFPHQGWKRHCLPCLARLRVDGFAGFEASASDGEGTVVTQPLRVTGPIQVSADVHGGELQVSVLDEADIPPTRLASDLTDGDVWTGKIASALIGKVVRLKFDLRGAKLYAIRGVELVPAPPAPRVRRDSAPMRAPRTFAFDESDSGWRGIDKLEHRSGGFVTASRAGGLRPIAFLPHDAQDGLAGDWWAKFGGAGATIAFRTRCADAGGSFQLELFARDIAQWSYAKFPKFTADWQHVSATVRWDWNDTEAEAAGWVRGPAAFSWRETMAHVGKVVVVAGPAGQSSSFDLDDFTVTAFAGP